jgi:hypothetical protein
MGNVAQAAEPFGVRPVVEDDSAPARDRLDLLDALSVLVVAARRLQRSVKTGLDHPVARILGEGHVRGRIGGGVAATPRTGLSTVVGLWSDWRRKCR